MTDTEYQKAWRQRQKDIRDGKLVVEERRKPTHAEYMKAYRERQRRKAGKPSPEEERCLSDQALEAAILKRGRQLSQMMRTPASMWPAEWTEDTEC